MPPAGPRVNSAKTGYPQIPFARGTGRVAPTCRALKLTRGGSGDNPRASTDAGIEDARMAEKTTGPQKLDQAIGRLEQAANRIKDNARPAAEVDSLKAQADKLAKDSAALKAERDKLAAEVKSRDAEIARLEKTAAEAAERVDAVLGDIRSVLGA